jgi:oligoribonuclease NrnB/cAMP/cGMP phosphodiesterase (DHH superfamily)
MTMSKSILPDLEKEPTAVKTLFPDPDYFSSWNDAQKQKKESIDEQFDGKNPDIVCITHTDADGYGCEVMLREAYPNKEIVVITASAGRGPLKVPFVSEHVAKHISQDTPVYITDLSPNEGKGVDFIHEFRNQKELVVIDHHEWSEDNRQQIEWVAEVYHDTDRCATKITHDVLIENPRPEITALAELTQDHDLWIKEDRERSDALADLSKFVSRDVYVNLAREFGDDVIQSEEGLEYIKQSENERNTKTKLAIDRATFHDVNGYKLGIAYGGCDSSDVGEKLYTEYDVDLACIMYPAGQLSFRSPDGTDNALRMAKSLDGGGHPAAAGAKPDKVGDEIQYEVHWTTKGEALRNFVVDKFEEVTS